MRIAFVGPIEAGKSTLCRKFVSEIPEAVHLSFAAGLKEEAAYAVANGDQAEYHRILTEMYDPEEKKKWRTLLQVWGTDVRRDIYGPNYWVNKLQDKLNYCANKDIFIDDCRFPNEYEMLEAEDFSFYRLAGPKPFDPHDPRNRHESELYWPKFEVDGEIPWEPVQDRFDRVMWAYESR